MRILIISSLERLELQPYLIARLKNIGIGTISDLAISVPQDLFEHCGMTDERSALDLVMRAKKTLIGSGTLVKDFSTADDLLKRRKNLLKCSTGSSRLDSFLKGGIETQAMTEIRKKLGFSNQFEFALFEELQSAKDTENAEISAKETTKTIFNNIEEETNIVDWKTKKGSEKRISVSIYDVLSKNGFPRRQDK